MTLTELQMLVTPEGVSDSLDNQIYASLTYNDTKNATVACRSAARWCYGQLGVYGASDRAFDNDEQMVLTEAMTQRAIYELGLISQFDEDFDAYADDAMLMLKAVLKIASAKPEQGSGFVGAARVSDEQSHLNVPFESPSRRR